MVYGLTSMISVPHTRRLISSQHSVPSRVHSQASVFVRADTVASLHGVGKATVIKITKKGTFSLSKVGDVKADMKSMQAQATEFICAAYGKVAEPCTSMTEYRVKTWRSKIGKSGASSVKLCSLPVNQ